MRSALLLFFFLALTTPTLLQAKTRNSRQYRETPYQTNRQVNIPTKQTLPCLPCLV